MALINLCSESLRRISSRDVRDPTYLALTRVDRIRSDLLPDHPPAGELDRLSSPAHPVPIRIAGRARWVESDLAGDRADTSRAAGSGSGGRLCSRHAEPAMLSGRPGGHETAPRILIVDDDPNLLVLL